MVGSERNGSNWMLQQKAVQRAQCQSVMSAAEADDWLILILGPY